MLEDTFNGTGLVKVQLNSLCYSSRQQLLIVGASDRSCVTFDMTSACPLHVCNTEEHPIRTLVFLCGVGAFAASDEGGKISLWSTEPRQEANVCFATFRNVANENEHCSFVNAMLWVGPDTAIALKIASGGNVDDETALTHTLFTGDEEGNVTLNFTIYSLLIFHLGSIRSWDLRSIVQTDPPGPCNSKELLRKGWKAHDTVISHLEVCTLKNYFKKCN